MQLAHESNNGFKLLKQIQTRRRTQTPRSVGVKYSLAARASVEPAPAAAAATDWPASQTRRGEFFGGVAMVT